MKAQTIIILALAILVIALAAKILFFGKGACNDNKRDAISNIMTRTSIRAYTDEALTKEQIDTLLRAGMAAPSALNKQPWEFVVIDDKETLKALKGIYKGARMADQAAVGIAVCGNMQNTIEGEGQGYWVDDASAATENILLAAHAMGLGAVWTGVHVSDDRVTGVRELLSLPEYVTPLCVIMVGHPAENPEPKDKYNAEKIHYNKW